MPEVYIGRCDKALTNELIETLNEVFFSEEPEETRNDFLGLLPKLYKDKYEPAYNNVIVAEDGKIKGAVGLFPMTAYVDGEEIRIGGIGNVATTSDSRGKSYMIDCMNMCLDIMKQDGTVYSVLNGQRQRYAHFGFESGGMVLNFNFNKSNLDRILGKDAKSAYTWKKLTEDDKETVEKALALYNRNTFRYERTTESFCDILMSWRAVPYAFFDGDEFRGYVSLGGDGSIAEIEFCEEKDFFEIIMCAMQITGKDSFGINVAPFKTEFCDFLYKYSSGNGVGHCHRICILDFKRFIKAFLALKAKSVSLCDGKVVLLIHGIKEDEKLEVAISNGKVSVENTDKSADIELSHNEGVTFVAGLYSPERTKLPSFAQNWFPVYDYAGSEDNV